MQVEKFSPGDSAKFIGERSGRFALPVIEEIFGECIPKGLDHVAMLSESDNDNKGACPKDLRDHNLWEVCRTRGWPQLGQ